MKLTQLPSLTFADADIDELDLQVTSTVEELLGRKLARADPLRLFLRGVEAVIQQQRLLIDQCAKMNLLAYSTGDYLDHLGALVGVERMSATAATVTMELTLSALRSKATVIPRGVRFTAGDGVYFALDEDLTIPKNTLSMPARATCTARGPSGNWYDVGEINQIVDPQPFLQSAVNITASDGGADIESDDALRERIHEAPESFSVAGPYGAYRWFAMSASALISDVAVTSPEPGVVRIVPLMSGGELPSQEIIDAVNAACNNRAVRPLTDTVIVDIPLVVRYSIELTYYISRAKATAAASIDDAAKAAVAAYIDWQRECLGRDINPTELIHRLRAAGVKRVVLTEPQFTVLDDTQVAMPFTDVDGNFIVNANFGGLEDD